DLSATYEAANEEHSSRLVLQGQAALSTAFGDVDVNFAEPNAITIENGHTAFVGTISLTDVVVGSWGLKSGFISIDTNHGALDTGAVVHLPLGFDLHVELGFVHGQLNSLLVGAQDFDGGGLPIEDTPIFLQSISGEVDHLANSDS